MGLIFFVCGSFSFAEIPDEELLKEIGMLKEQIKRQEKKIEELERRISEKEGPIVQLSDVIPGAYDRDTSGRIDITCGATFIIQGTNNANGSTLSQGGEDVIDASYSIDLFIEKEFDNFGKGLIHIEPGDGFGVEDELQVFSNVNRDSNNTDNSSVVTEAYYEYHFETIPVSFTFGKIDSTILIDTNEYANDETTKFLGRIFRNSPVIEFPDNTSGIKIDINPVDFFEARFLMMDADANLEDIAGGGFFATQLTFKPHLFQRDGNYRIIGWLNDDDHRGWGDSIKTKEYSYGFGVSLDQQVKDNLGVFLRYGWQDPDVYLNNQTFSLEGAWSIGVELRGEIWDRKDDVLGIAIGEVIPSHKYRKAGADLRGKDEAHFEMYYTYRLNQHLSLSPDIQIILDPYGGDATNGDETITVLGLRGQIDF